MSQPTLAERSAAAVDQEIQQAAANAKSGATKPAVHEILFPVNVSYFPKAVTKQDGDQFTAHEFSISVAHKNKAGETQWNSLSIKRRDAHKLLTALQSVYQASYKIKPEDTEE